LLLNENLTDGAFDWMQVLKHHMDINTVLRAKTEPEEKEDFSLQLTLPGKG
jgi:hypothetical protein